MAGVSPQQVRNYIDVGLLPPVERTASGYRIFTARHAEALVTVRQVAAGHGWERARIIMSAVHEGDVAAALAAVDARRNALIGQLARAIGVRPPVLRLWRRLQGSAALLGYLDHESGDTQGLTGPPQ